MTLILPNGQSHRSTKRGSDFITIDEAQQMMIGLYGPLASLVKEMALKLQMDGTEESAGPGHCQTCHRGWDFCNCPGGVHTPHSGDIE